jgi:hypothetical protein
MPSLLRLRHNASFALHRRITVVRSQVTRYPHPMPPLSGFAIWVRRFTTYRFLPTLVLKNHPPPASRNKRLSGDSDPPKCSPLLTSTISGVSSQKL